MNEHEWDTTTDVAAMMAWITPTRSGDASPAQVAGGHALGERQARLFHAAACCPQCPSVSMDALEKAVYVAGALCGSRERKATILRCIAGSPFRPVTLPRGEEFAWCNGCNGGGKDLSAARHPEECPPCYHCGGTGETKRTVSPFWLTPTVRVIAEGAYASGNQLDRATLDALIDALLEAGAVAEETCRRCGGSGDGIHPNGLMQRVACLSCHGRGLVPATEACERCGGKGKVSLKPHRYGPDPDDLKHYVYRPPDETDCDDCDGSGRVVTAAARLVAHLREPEHWRGCWALDCLLGKE